MPPMDGCPKYFAQQQGNTLRVVVAVAVLLLHSVTSIAIDGKQSCPAGDEFAFAEADPNAGIVQVFFQQTSPQEVFAEPDTEFLPDVDVNQEPETVAVLKVVEENDSATSPDFLSTPEPSRLELPPTNSVEECGEEVTIQRPPKDDGAKRLSFHQLMSEPFSVYRTAETGISWIPGTGQSFGWFDWVTEPYLNRGDDGSFISTINMHFLAGPNSSPLPPRLYDLVLGYQWRDSFSDRFSYDLYSSIGLYTDFEGSARDGVRFPGHAVGMLHMNPSADLVFGIDYLDRDEVSVLPVFGLSLHDLHVPNLRLDLVFPRPRIDYAFSDRQRMYLAGSTGGGKWDVDFPDGSDQVMSYRDYRLVLGFERADDDGELSALEFGWVFGRSLSFRRSPGDTQFEDAFLIRWVTRR